MIDAKAVGTIDTQGMAGAYSQWPQMAREAYAAPLEPVADSGPDHIVFAGMGGSGAISDIFESILSSTGVHVDIVKGYHLPKTAGPGTLVVATSISGNTAETLHILGLAAGSGCQTVAFSDGGRIEKYCASNGLAHRHVGMIHSPRASMPSFLYSMLSVLRDCIPVPEADVAESVSVLESMAESVSDPGGGRENAALALAEWLPEVPIIYYPWGLRAAAIRFKNSLQENAKAHAMAEDVMEACHNGIVSWTCDSVARPILIQGGDDHARTKERWAILEGFFAHRGISYRKIEAPGSSILARIVGLIYVLDYASIYRAVIRGIDPTPVAPIEYIKERLAD